mmetsp:Transcript_40056/g.68330  ORF Transcript_40056/g.68330 Transcript_40056/m.68330 type:complete len:246 (+) Transcript_40056:726-1463(+)
MPLSPIRPARAKPSRTSSHCCKSCTEWTNSTKARRNAKRNVRGVPASSCSPRRPSLPIRSIPCAVRSAKVWNLRRGVSTRSLPPPPGRIRPTYGIRFVCCSPIRWMCSSPRRVDCRRYCERRMPDWIWGMFVVWCWMKWTFCLWMRRLVRSCVRWAWLSIVEMMRMVRKAAMAMAATVHNSSLSRPHCPKMSSNPSNKNSPTLFNSAARACIASRRRFVKPWWTFRYPPARIETNAPVLISRCAN